MKFTIISGSTREQAASLNVSKYIKQQLVELDSGISTQIMSLADTQFPMWEESTDTTMFSESHEQLAQSDAFVFVVPEWHGMVPPAVKNLFFLFNGVFRHKPAFIVTVSSGSGGRYPIQEMRSTTYKNSFINYLPVNAVIDRVNSIIDNEGNYIAEKAFVKNRIDEGIKLLREYGTAFVAIRGSDIVIEKRFPNGV